MKKKVLFIIAIAVILIGAIAAIIIFKKNNNNDDNSLKLQDMDYIEISEEDALTVTEWMHLLSVEFGYDDPEEYSDEKILGKDAVVAGFDQLGIAFEDYVLEGLDNTVENKASVAVDLDVISEDYLDSYIGEEQAEILINNLKAIQSLTDYHVDINEIQLADGIIDGTTWNAQYYAVIDDKEEVIIETGDYIPQVNEQIVFTDLGGVLRGGTVVAVQERGKGKYDMLLSPFTAEDNVIEDYTIAGYVDFSYIQTLNSATIDTGENIAYQADFSDDFPAGEFTQTSTKHEWSGSTDLHLKLDVIKEAGKKKQKVRVRAAELGDYDITGYVEAAQKVIDGLNASDDIISGASTKSIDISLNDLTLYTYFKNNEAAEIEVSCLPIVECEEGLSGDISIPIGELPLGNKFAEVNVSITIEISTNLDVSIKLEPTYPISVGVHMGEHNNKQMANRPPLDCNIVDFISSESLDLSVNAKISRGFGIEVEASLLGITICDPKLNITIEVAAKALDPVGDYDVGCIEVRNACPIVEIELTRDDDLSIMGEVISINRWPSEIVLNDPDVSDFVNAEYTHIEISPEFNKLDDPLGNASVCTHYPDGESHKADPKIKFSGEAKAEEFLPVTWADLEPEYKEWINERNWYSLIKDDFEVAYIHIDDDNIPELVVYTHVMNYSSYVLTIHDGKAVEYSGKMSDAYPSYSPYSGYLFYPGGAMDVYYDKVVQLKNGEFIEKNVGRYTSDGEYTWDGVDISEEEYNFKVNTSCPSGSWIEPQESKMIME